MANEKEFHLIVPSQDNSSDPIHAAYIENIAAQMAAHFGGVTVYPAGGCYAPNANTEKDPDKLTLSCDPDVVIVASELEGRPKHPEAVNMAFMNELAQKVGKALGQGDVYVSELTDDVAKWEPGEWGDNARSDLIDHSAPSIQPSHLFEHIIPGRRR